MFSSQARIDSKTGADDLERFEYLQALVTEFQDTDKQGEVNLKLCFLTVSCSSLFKADQNSLFFLEVSGLNEGAPFSLYCLY